MSSSRLKSEEIYRERIVSDSLLKSRTRNNSSDQQIGQPQQQQQQQQQQRQQLEPTVEDVSRGSEDVFGPPPLSKDSSSRNKSKVTSLFDDSDSGDDLFGSASTSSRGTPSRSVPPSTTSAGAAKKKSIFDDDEDDLFGPPRDDLFSSVPTTSTGRGLFDQDIFGGKKSKPEEPEVPTPTQSQKSTNLFPGEPDALFPKPIESRARIPKRRPQSREARQIAIRNSGIDFDIVDASDSPTREQPQITNGQSQPEQGGDSLAPPKQHDDRSELSLSKNTTTNLLSPSTDEEDLFDVPPELPEDPSVKEDTLFDKGPVLSPVTERKKIDTNETKIEQKKGNTSR
ncbi:unnamed protein product [Trichogramma brassicae]|uniref:FAM21/CAPZIP domain-containing protein n=1 Tax=Trichogramma brassicae TaxID=86971 RepID=A0A6H5HWV0_9HYME|nr:unnamed protein product [Trichogramma brassicae]